MKNFSESKCNQHRDANYVAVIWNKQPDEKQRSQLRVFSLFVILVHVEKLINVAHVKLVHKTVVMKPFKYAH